MKLTVARWCWRSLFLHIIVTKHTSDDVSWSVDHNVHWCWSGGLDLPHHFLLLFFLQLDIWVVVQVVMDRC